MRQGGCSGGVRSTSWKVNIDREIVALCLSIRNQPLLAHTENMVAILSHEKKCEEDCSLSDHPSIHFTDLSGVGS